MRKKSSLPLDIIDQIESIKNIIRSIAILEKSGQAQTSLPLLNEIFNKLNFLIGHPSTAPFFSDNNNSIKELIAKFKISKRNPSDVPQAIPTLLLVENLLNSILKVGRAKEDAASIARQITFYLGRARGLSGSTLKLLDDGEIQASIVVINAAHDDITLLLSHLERLGEISQLYAKKIGAIFEKDRSIIQSLSKKGPNNGFGKGAEDYKRVRLAALHLQKLVDLLGSEIEPVFNPVNKLLFWIVENKKTLVTVFAILIVLGAVAGNIRKIIYKGHGLRGEYFSDTSLTHLAKVNTDMAINFDWGDAGPLNNFISNGFSIRWKGILNVPLEGPVEFQTWSDDGVRLWIDDQLLIDDWNSHAATKNNAVIPFLSQGQHKIRMEYFDDTSVALVKLYWKLSNQSNSKIIPSRYLLLEPDK